MIKVNNLLGRLYILYKRRGAKDSILLTLKYLFYILYFRLKRIQDSANCHSIYGPLFVSNFKDVTFYYCIVGSYGFYFTELLKQSSDVDVFIDIGANQGLYTLIAAENNNIAKVYCFEPNDFVLKLLEQNVILNGYTAKVKIFPFALSDFSGKVGMNYNEQHTGLSSINDEMIGKTVDVFDSRKISDIIEILDYNKIGIKIDTEGQEEKIIHGLLNSNIANNIHWIYVEMNRTRFDVDSVIYKLSMHGFEKVYVRGSYSHFDVLFKKSKNYSQKS